MTLLPRFAELADERFVSLTTFRKSGERVSTAVWIARDGDALLVTTPEGTGKLKRLRNNPAVELRPCNRMGKVDPSEVPVAGVAAMERGPDAEKRLTEVFLAKYKLEYRIFMTVERIIAGRQAKKAERAGKPGNKERVMLRITPA